MVRPGQQLLFYFILCANFRVHDPVRAAVRVQDYNQVRQKIYISHHTVEEGDIQKRRQRSSLLLGGQFNSIKFIAALAIFQQDNLKKRLIWTRTS